MVDHTRSWTVWDPYGISGTFWVDVPRNIMHIYEHMYSKVTLSIFYGRRIPTEIFVPCWRNKIKKKKQLQGSDFFSCRKHVEDFGCFWTEKLPIWEKIYSLLSQRKKWHKTKMAFFFLIVWDNFISSEDLSHIEYKLRVA